MALLAAILIAVVIALWVSGGKEISAKDWLLTGVPAWLQGLGTVGAAYVAWLAFGTWKRQERARRRAELAEKLLHSAAEFWLSIARVRTNRLILPDEPLEQIAAEETDAKTLARVNELRALADRFRTLGLAAGHILGIEVTRCVVSLVHMQHAVCTAHEELSRIAKGDADMDEDVVKACLTVIGCQSAFGDDKFRHDGHEAYKKLEAALAPHLSFDLKPDDE